MSILSDLDNMVLFDTNHPPLGNKAGSPLTPAEWDARVTAMYDAIQSIVSGVNVTAYNPATTYDSGSTDIYKKYAGYNSRIWQAIGSFTGETPEEGVYWTQVTLAELMPDPLALIARNDNCECLHSASLTIASADVLQLNSTPLTIVAAQGAGTAIEVISASVRLTYGSVQYATNTVLLLKTSGASEPQVKWAQSILGASSNMLAKSIESPNTSSDMIENAGLQVSVSSGNPTAGDSDITVYVTYRVIQL